MSIDSWCDDSILSRAGYRADGSQSQVKREIYMNKAIDGRMDNALEALHHLRWLVDDRGYRCRRAQDIWRNDIAYVSRIINSGTLQEADAISVAHHVTKIKNQQRSRDPFAFLRYRHIREVKAHTTTA